MGYNHISQFQFEKMSYYRLQVQYIKMKKRDGRGTNRRNKKVIISELYEVQWMN